jgi:hypothetical protein
MKARKKETGESLRPYTVIQYKHQKGADLTDCRGRVSAD